VPANYDRSCADCSFIVVLFSSSTFFSPPGGVASLHCELVSVSGPGGAAFASYEAPTSVPLVDVVFEPAGVNSISIPVPWVVRTDQFQAFETTHTGDPANRELKIALQCDSTRVSLDPFDGYSILFTQQAAWQIKTAPAGVFSGTDSCTWTVTDVSPYLGVAGYYFASPDAMLGLVTPDHFVSPPLDANDMGSYIRVSSSGQDYEGATNVITITYELLIPLQPGGGQIMDLWFDCPGADSLTSPTMQFVSDGPMSQTIGFYFGCSVVDITCSMQIDMISRQSLTTEGLDLIYGNARDITFTNVGGYNCGSPSSSTGAGAGGISGDPQFVGFRGQSYQVHGIPGQIYDIVSTPRLQVNALFVFLSSGVCPREIKKAYCYTHPGTFLGEVGIRVRVDHAGGQRSEETTIRIEAGSWKSGLRVYVNETLISVSSEFAVDLKHHNRPLSHARLAQLLLASGAGVGPSASASAALVQQAEGEDAGDELSNITSVEVLKQEWKEAQRLAALKVDPELAKAAGGLFDKKANSTGDDFLRRTWTRWVLSHPSRGEVQLLTPDFSLTFLNSDGFLNQEVRLINPKLMRLDEEKDDDEEEAATTDPSTAHASSRLACHGVLGQTVVYRRYPNRWRFIQGDINEYQVENIFATNSKYNVYAHHADGQHHQAASIQKR
jgi:hypothetical protein